MHIEQYPRKCIWVPIYLRPEELVPGICETSDEYFDLQQEILSEGLFNFVCFYDDELTRAGDHLAIFLPDDEWYSLPLKHNEILEFASKKGFSIGNLLFEVVMFENFCSTDYCIGIRVS